MKYNSILKNLCIFDTRNPDCDLNVDMMPRQPGCHCSNCSTGRDILADELTKRVIDPEIALLNQLINLDMSLTEQNFQLTSHTQKTFRNKMQLFLEGELYYLSDGGYSRIFIFQADSDQGGPDVYKLGLASESAPRVQKNWTKFPGLIANINRTLTEIEIGF